MTKMKQRKWFQARLRWAVLEEGWGLDHWLEAEHIYLSEDRESAFQEALEQKSYADAKWMLKDFEQWWTFAPRLR